MNNDMNHMNNNYMNNNMKKNNNMVNDINNNLMMNYTNNNNMMNLNNNINLNNNKNFVKKNNFPMMINNTNNSNMIINNIRNQIPQNTNPNFLYYQNQINPNLNNFYYNNNQPQTFMFPENAFSYNNTNINSSKNNNITSKNQNNNRKDNNNEKKNKAKKKFKDKIEQKLFVIDLDNIIKGDDNRTTVMIRHIPNKYTSQALLDEINMVCKNTYDFFYLPIDNDNDCNLGYAFINFINPLHIVHFYHYFKQRKWKLYKSNKECDLTFAKFQGKSELTANLDKNMNKIEDKKKLPMVLDVFNPPKINLEKKYYEEIKKYRSELLQNINWI
jgi:hypothetical protein